MLSQDIKYMKLWEIQRTIMDVMRIGEIRHLLNTCCKLYIWLCCCAYGYTEEYWSCEAEILSGTSLYKSMHTLHNRCQWSLYLHITYLSSNMSNGLYQLKLQGRNVFKYDMSDFVLNKPLSLMIGSNVMDKKLNNCAFVVARKHNRFNDHTRIRNVSNLII
jgi:hypothetical protein